MSQDIIFNKEARAKLQTGVDKVANAVRITMGPKGKVVVIKKGDPIFTLDGVTVAESVMELKDEVENMGASLIKSVAKKTNDGAGDGTTTGTLLGQSLLKAGLKGVENNLDAIVIKKAYEDGSRVIMDELKNMARPVKTEKEMSDIATISSRDREIGDIIATIYKKIGVDGLIVTEESKVIGTSYEILQGTQIDNGWISPYFITHFDRKERAIEDPYVLVTTQSLSTNDEVVAMLNMVYETDKKSLVVVAEDVSGEALATMVKNKMMGIMKILVVKAPGHGEHKQQYLEDIATLTGAEIISEKTGTKVQDMKLEQMGRCGKVVANKTRTMFVDGKGKKSEVNKRLAVLKKEIKEEESDYKRQVVEKRYARLLGGVAVIRTGSISEAESKEKQYRIEDAVNSTKSAIQEGIVIGGGLALVKTVKVLNVMISKATDHSYRFGLEALREAIMSPSRQILENAGYQPDVILAEIDRKGANIGYNAGTGEYCDMFKVGVIDPVKVERVALENSVSVVGMFLITGAVVYDEKEEPIKNDNQQ